MTIQLETNPLAIIKSVSTVNFTGAAAQNVPLSEDLLFPHEHSHSREGIIESIGLISVQNLQWDVIFYGGAAKFTTIDADTFIAKQSFLVADGINFTGQALYYYGLDSLNIFYRDTDAADINAATLHVALVNRSAAAKIAGVNGGVVLIVGIRPLPFV